MHTNHRASGASIAFAILPALLLASCSTVSMVDQKGFGWSNRCFFHLRAGALPFARAACQKGLEAGPDRETKGSLFFNYAMVEEATGDPVGACKMLSQSIAVRPNKYAQQMVDKLECVELMRGP